MSYYCLLLNEMISAPSPQTEYNLNLIDTVNVTNEKACVNHAVLYFIGCKLYKL